MIPIGSMTFYAAKPFRSRLYFSLADDHYVGQLFDMAMTYDPAPREELIRRIKVCEKARPAEARYLLDNLDKVLTRAIEMEQIVRGSCKPISTILSTRILFFPGRKVLV